MHTPPAAPSSAIRRTCFYFIFACSFRAVPPNLLPAVSLPLLLNLAVICYISGPPENSGGTIRHIFFHSFTVGFLLYNAVL
jgi:hypothetical protein